MEENNDNIEKEQFSLKNISEDKLANQATIRDLILFKEDILKEMRQYASKIKTSLGEKFNKFVQDANQKLPVSSTDNAGLYMKTIKFIEEKNGILSTVSEKEANLNEKIMVNDLHINNCQKELNDAVFKYDRAILDNLLIPGLVGKGCKFLNFKEYIINIQEQINEAFSKLDYNGDNINKNKKSLEEQINTANTKIKNLEYESKQFTFEKSLALENKIKQDMETVHNNILELTGNYYKNNVELKNQIESLKNAEKLITEENRKINNHTLKEFDIIQKGFKHMKKTIIDLGKLLMLSDKRSKTNKNFAANKQIIIEQFNNMMLDLVKDTKKEKYTPPPKEVINPKPSTKKAVSVIKQYIEGKIQADDANNYGEKERKKNSAHKERENEEIYKRSSIKKPSYIVTNKPEELNSSRSNNNKMGVSVEKHKRFSRHASVEFKDIKDVNKINSIGSINESDSKKNNNVYGEASKSKQFDIIKEEKNNMSKSDEQSLFSDLEEDFKNLKLNEDQSNLFNYKGYENKKYNYNYNEEESSLFRNENKPKKFNKQKAFFRAATQNYDKPKEKKIENANQQNESFKLLLKAQENLKKKNLEKQLSKKENDSSQFIEKKVSSKKVTFSNQDKIIEKKQNYNNDNFTPKATISIDNQEIQNKDSKSNDISSTINHQNTENKSIIKNYNPINSDKVLEKKEQNKENKIKLTKENQKINNLEIKTTEKINIEIKEVKKEEENKKNSENINVFPKEKASLNYKLKDNLDNNTLTQKQIKFKNKNNISNNINNFTKTQYGNNFMPLISKSKNNISPENNRLKLTTTENNKENIKREINLSANIKNKHHNIIAKFPTQISINKSSIPSLKALKINNDKIKESQIKYSNRFRTNRNLQLLNEDIFVNKDDMKKMNYYKDQDIIDKPLLVNQVNFNIQNSKGTIENKLIELEYFTKKKFDELVREIKNFIPIHFNAYIKE